MQDITILLWIGAFVALVLQYKIRIAPLYFCGMGLGMGGIVQALAEYDAGGINESVTIIMSILCIMTVIYSIWNYSQSFNRGSK